MSERRRICVCGGAVELADGPDDDRTLGRDGNWVPDWHCLTCGTRYSYDTGKLLPAILRDGQDREGQREGGGGTMLKSVNVIAMRNAALESAAVLRPEARDFLALLDFAKTADVLAWHLQCCEKEEEKHE